MLRNRVSGFRPVSGSGWGQGKGYGLGWVDVRALVLSLEARSSLNNREQSITGPRKTCVQLLSYVCLSDALGTYL